jgi:hypothetical protein
MSDLKVRPAREKQDSLVRSVQRRQEFVLADRLRKGSLRVSPQAENPRAQAEPRLQTEESPPRKAAATEPKMATASGFELEAGGGQPVEAAPDEAIDQDHDGGHDQRGG